MKKFVRYLYEYRGEKRVQNVGFVRVDEQENEASIQIYGKGFPVVEGKILEIFMVYIEENACVGISMGKINDPSPVLGYRLQYDTDDVHGKENFERIEGMILRITHGDQDFWYAAQWQEMPWNVEQMVPYEKLQERLTETEPEEVVEAGENVEEEEIVESTEEIQVEAAEEAEILAEEVVLEEVEQSTVKEKDEIFKITRQDLVKLPRCEWKLANNHFLLHGYRNYHHLVSFEKAGECWLGIPGVFHPSEQKVATAFGFEQFMKPDEGEIELCAEEREEAEEFGYWCRRVSTVVES